MSVTLLCSLSLIISVLILVITTVLSVVAHKTELSKENLDKKRKITPFQIFLLGYFIAAVVLFYPIYYADFLVADSGIVKVIKSILLSIQYMLSLFTLNGTFDNVKALFDNHAVPTVLSSLYTVYASIILVASPALTAGFVLSFFKGAAAFVRYKLYPRADIYILSELNKRSLILARDILMDESNKRRRLVVFTDVFDKEDEENFELISQAKRLGAVCMKKDVSELGLKRSDKIFRKIYLIGDDEDENIKQALTLIERCRSVPRYNTDKTQIYVFANNVESEVLLNSVDNGEIKVRQINENRNLALQTLDTYSIFKDARIIGDKKEISVAIVGLGAYGIELLKAICWFGQMPGYVVTIHVFDKEPSGQAKVKNIAPDLIKYNRKELKGEPYYNIIFHDNIDVNSSEFQEELSNIDFVSSAFVTLGDDELNIETALKMRVQFGRDAISSGKNVPPIYAVVYSMAKTQAASHGGIKNMCDEDYGISFIGSIKSRYSLESIERSKLEEEGLKCHLHWVSHVEETDEEIAKFNKYEYYRRSSIAEAIYLRFREKLLLGADPELLKEYEHKRWSAYMRSEGYIGLGDKKDFISKTHPSLIPYQELSETEQNKDDI